MAGPPKKKQLREEKNSEELAFFTEAHSDRNICVPMLNAEYIRIRHPFGKNDLHTRTDSAEFFATYKEFCEKGLRVKLAKEFEFFANSYDPKWSAVFANAEFFCNSNNTTVE